MALGIKKGDHIAVWAYNVPEWVYLQFASAKIGAILVTVNTYYKSHELEYLLKQSDATSLFLVDEFKGVNYLDILKGYFTIAFEIRPSCALQQLFSHRGYCRILYHKVKR